MESYQRTFPAQMMRVLMQYYLTKTFAVDNLIKGKCMIITANKCYDILNQIPLLSTTMIQVIFKI